MIEPTNGPDAGRKAADDSIGEFLVSALASTEKGPKPIVAAIAAAKKIAAVLRLPMPRD